MTLKATKKKPPLKVPEILSSLMEQPVHPAAMPKDRHAFNRDSKWDPVIRFINNPSNNPYPDWTPLKNAPKAGTSTTTYLKNRYQRSHNRPSAASKKSPATRTPNPNYIPGFEAITVQGKCYVRIVPTDWKGNLPDAS